MEEPRESRTDSPLFSSVHAVIMAGGKGVRFWPLSTSSVPKPFIRGLFEQTLFRMTIDRIRAQLSPDTIWLVVGERHVEQIFQEAPEIRPDRVLIEPEGRDTAAAITFAAFEIMRQFGSGQSMVVLPCDHYITPTDAFWETVKVALLAIESHPDHLVTIGIPPVRPDVNYGYIEVDSKISLEGHTLYHVRSFKEKPDAKTAQQYVSAGRYFWNSGMFIWKVETILDHIKRYLPETYKIFETLYDHTNPEEFPDQLNSVYPRLPRISIDYGVMERADNILMVPASFQWDDIGQWEALDRVIRGDDQNNRIIGDGYIDGQNVTIVSPDAKVMVIGADDLVVVHHQNRILVMKKGKGSRLKDILKQLPTDWYPE